MPRIRTIKPEFWKHEALSELPEATHLLAAALLNYADDEGYFNANPRLVQAECCPLREPSVSVHDSLIRLSSIGYLQLGTDTNGRRYGHIVHFAEHQRVNRPSASKIKQLEIQWDDSLSPHGMLTEHSPLEGNREQGTGNRERKIQSPSGDSSKSLTAICDPAPAKAGEGHAKNGLTEPKQAAKAATARQMADIWNRTCGDVLPRARGDPPPKQRQQRMLARYAEIGRSLERWELVCRRVRASDFLTGQAAVRNGREPFRASLDWVLAPSNFVKVVEGNYDNRGSPGRESIDEWAKRLAREHGERHAEH